MIFTRYHAPQDLRSLPIQPTDCLLLRFDQRCRSRFSAITTTKQAKVHVLLARGVVIQNGAFLTNESGDCVEVIAADEKLYRVTAENPHALLRAAYHLGNRHVRLEIRPEYLQLEPDNVLRDMLERLGGVRVELVEAMFDPEIGAYGGGHHHGHDETFQEDYAAAQAVFHAHHGPS
jgi:urease accessory protein